MRYRELAKRLKKLGCVAERHAKGSHYFWRNLTNGQATSIPDWGGKDLKPGTVRGIVRDLGISHKEFDSIK